MLPTLYLMIRARSGDYLEVSGCKDCVLSENLNFNNNVDPLDLET